MNTSKLALVRNTLTAAVLVGLLAACATVPQVRTESSPNLDLSVYRTYGYVAKPGTDQGNYRSLTTQDLEAAVDREMQARGFVKSAHPDLLIDFRTHVQNQVEGSWGPSYGMGMGWGGWGWGGWGWGDGWGWGGMGPGWWGGPGWGYGGDWGDIQTYSKGTLTINVIDAKTRDAVWSGSAVADITEDTLAHPRTSIDRSVGAIFAKFPMPPAAGGGPAH